MLVCRSVTCFTSAAVPSPKLEIALVALPAPSVTKVVPPPRQVVVPPSGWKWKKETSLGGFRGVPEKKKKNVEIGDDFGLGCSQLWVVILVVIFFRCVFSKNHLDSEFQERNTILGFPWVSPLLQCKTWILGPIRPWYLGTANLDFLAVPILHGYMQGDLMERQLDSWKGEVWNPVLIKGMPGNPNHRAPNHQFTNTWKT